MRSSLARRRHPLAAATAALEQLVLRHFGLHLSRAEAKEYAASHAGTTGETWHALAGERLRDVERHTCQYGSSSPISRIAVSATPRPLRLLEAATAARRRTAPSGAACGS